MIDVIDLFNACVYIQDHLDADLSLLFLAQTVGLSRFRFHRVFKAWRGETLHEFVTRMRMERAAFELTYPVPRSSRRSIKAIAFASGYKSLSSFSHAFSSYAQLSPREFRNRALRNRPSVLRYSGDPTRLGDFSVTISDEPAREIAVFDPVTRAGDALGSAGRAALRDARWVEGDRYGVELLPNLFVRSRRQTGMAAKSAPMSCVGADILDWKRSVAGRGRTHDHTPRTTIKLDGGRYAVIQGRGSVAEVYRAWRRGFDGWLAATGECPRSARFYMRFGQDAVGDFSSFDFSLYIPLEPLPATVDSRTSSRRRSASSSAAMSMNPSTPNGVKPALIR